MSLFPGWRAAFRIARRDALRAKGRSALVVAMIALPVLGVTAADLTYRSALPTAAEELTADLGAADALFVDQGMGPVPLWQMPDGIMWQTPDGAPETFYDDERKPVDVPATFPKGSRSLTEQSVPASVTTRHGITDTQITELAVADPMLRGRVELTEGSYPKAKDEIAATGAFLKAAGLSVGDRVTVRGPQQEYTLTGAVELPAELKNESLFAVPGAVIAPWQKTADGDGKILPPQASGVKWLVQGPPGAGVTWPDILAANEKGVVVRARQVALDPPPDSEVPMAVYAQGWTGSDTELTAAVLTVAAMALLEIVLLAGPAFAVGARRSRRQLGLVGSCGGTRGQVRAVVLAGGAVLGGVGAVVGVGAGFGLTVLFRPMIEEFSGRRFGELTVHPGEILAIAVLGLVTGVLAALAPAIVAGRQSVLESLTGRRGSRRSSRVLPVVGTVVLAVGVALAVYGGLSGNTRLVAGGSVLAELGLLGCIPVIVGFLGRLGRRLPLTPRIALRDAARNRGRTAPAVAAVMAAVAGSVAIATYTASTTAEQAYDHRPNLTAGTAALMTADTAEKTDLSRARAAVEQHYPVSGAPARVGRAWAGSDCSVYYEEEDGCGTLEIVKPTGEGHSCPLKGKGAKELALRISADEHKRLMNSPACVDEDSTTIAFGNDDNKIVIGDTALLTSYVKLDDPEAAKALAAGTPVLLNSAYAKDGEITLRARHVYNERDKENRALHPGEPRTTTDRLKVYVAPDSYATTPGIRMVLPQKTADRLGLHSQETGSVHTLTREPTGAEQQAADAALEQAGNQAYVWTGSPAEQDDDAVVLLILALFAGVVTLGAAAITTGLSKADAEADLTTLSAVGAPPGVRRSLSGFQCLVVALTGVLLGTAAGIVPAVALRLTDLREALKVMRDDPMESAYTPIVMPWPTIALLALVVPVLAGLLAAALTGSRQKLARRAG
ncbi:FtsX-like permease family protein [Streptomyces bacillaris]|uniref:FtsX-like permease family protein n=1 Tax=Streptomyces cavourensis TaxID=67258 RepID=A0ABY5FHI4_9ACTN|nr:MULTISPECIES: FtsX-like permease family protein [Streptomyces]NUW22294.1 FtsX-like permease family protein [Streptomyces roseoviolaceus]NUV80457.1 FtsX-like permease family protein [Streptomyces sp. CAI-155]NUV87341.1 FtsX-like permease family protein [Streptomyces sp. KAI-26]TQO31403.1 putative ABC transport system permease protein [Streptomyces cavourensis]UTR83091.1 FtsX-like permease family protein [Streptomyces cavourensis]